MTRMTPVKQTAWPNAGHGRVVELRFFAGLKIEEVAEALGVSPATVEREWVLARAWLYRQLSSHA